MLNIEKFFLIEKETLSSAFFYAGMTMAYFGSLNPWFLWPLGSYYIIVSSLCIIMSMSIEAISQKKIYTNQTFLLPISAFAILSCYQLIVNNGNIGGYIANIFHIFVFLALFRIKEDKLGKLIDILTNIMSILLVPSILGFLLYLLGFPLPNKDAEFNDSFYTFSNYYLFLLDDRSLFSIVPRFHAVFLEPSHLGVATCLLLLTQCGRWKKPQCIIMFVATIMTFSLEAYILLTTLFFLNLWIQKKNFIKKLIATIILLSTAVTAAFFYNNGDNAFHDLILLRLEVDDGEMAGNNRVTADFDTDYEQFLQSSDILIGRDMDYSYAGNAGYKVFFYENGLVGILLLILFYTAALLHTKNRRALIAALILASLDFIARAFPLWYSNFIPVYFMAIAFHLPITKKTKNNEQ